MLIIMSPCDEYKKLVEEWKAVRSQVSFAATPEGAEALREKADRLKRAMEHHVTVCDKCGSL
jgi:hypothetical protein